MKNTAATRLGLSLAALGLAMIGSLFAGGPNNLDFRGGYLRWKAGVPVPFTIDNGPLRRGTTGAVILSRDVGANIIRGEAAKWTAVPSASIELRDNGFLTQDVNADNYETFFGITGTQGPQVRPENPVIFDDDGKITDDLFGDGASNSTLGFAGIRFAQGNEFISGWSVLNGKRAADNSAFRQTVLHELGHFLGLDHTQGLIENWEDPAAGHLGDVPVMFPFGAEPQLPAEPITDDIAWLSWLYPEPTFPAQTGAIKGRVYRLRPGGPPLQGANVAAIPAIPDGAGGFTQSRRNIVTCVSDFLASGTGEYELPGLAPGFYFVRIDRLRSEFTEGSGIGPFDDRPTGFPTDFFDDQESATEDPTLKTLIQVSAGQTVAGVDFVANEPVAVFTRLTVGAPAVRLSLGDDDAKLVLFPDSFAFPFYGRLYREIYVNSDGNLTFGVGDARPGEPRTEDRFLSGPPRIAPLFTDMDPSLAFRYGGGVEADAGAGWVRFRWLSVPEYRPQGLAPPNSFFVTLFSTGVVTVEYGQLSITPDEDEVYGSLHSIVGLSPGAAANGLRVDLSIPNDFEYGETALYQVFPNETFDLNGRTIRFVTRLTELIFPFIEGDAQRFTGIAVTNLGDQEAGVSAELRGGDGNLLGFVQNPGAFQVEPDTQFASLAREIFGVPAGQAHAGWARLFSTRPDVGSFFQFGNGLTGALTKMDGSTALSVPSQKLFFTRIYQGAAVYPSFAGPRDAVTRLAIVNPGVQPITVTLRLYNPLGQQIGNDVVRPIAANGRIFDTVAAIFSRSDPLGDGFVEVLADGTGAVGFQLIELADTLLGLNAVGENASRLLYSAQLGHAASIFTSLKLVNPTNTAISVTVTAFIREASGTISQRIAGPFTLLQKQALQQNVQNLFALGPGASQAVDGSIKVESTVAGIVGDVVFGDPQNARYAAALPLQTRLFRKAVHSQISNGRVEGRPSLDSFTGLALFNPNSVQAQVQVEVFDREGLKIGERTITLRPNERISKLLYEPDLVPASLGLVRGYVVLTSNQPIVAQQLFGNLALDYLSAVVPTVVE